MRRESIASLLASALFLSACAQMPAEQAPPVGLTDIAERPAEKALLSGIRAYDDGHYPDAEKQLKSALKLSLTSPKDRASAHKYLAFIYCTSGRPSDCEASFRAALQADPSFTLSKSEAGHPLWGPVYKRVHP